MFSDRFWMLKVALSLGLFSWFCRLSLRDFEELSPHADGASVTVQGYENKMISLWARRVLGHAPDGFQVSSTVGPFRVLSDARPPVNEYVSVRGTVTAPRTVAAAAVQVNEGWAWKRKLNYAVSIVVLVVVLASFRGRFRGRLASGLFRNRF